MTASDWIGTIGVTILLLAFALNVTKKITPDSNPYLLLNTVGALLAGISSYMIHFWPFVVLEGIWVIATCMVFIKKLAHEKA